MQPNNDQNPNAGGSPAPESNGGLAQQLPVTQPSVGTPDSQTTPQVSAPTPNATPVANAAPQPNSIPANAPIMGNNGSNSTKKPLIIILSIVAAVVVAGILAAVYFLVIAKDSNNKNSSRADSSDSAKLTPVASDTTKSETAASETSSSKDIVDTLCYKFSVPTPHETLPTENACDTPLVFFGSESTASIDVMPAANGAKSLADMVTRWKKDFNTATIIKEEKVQVAGIDAQRILHRQGSAANGATARVAYVVYTAPKPYTVQGVKVEGFVLSGGYDEKNADSIKGMDAIIKGWAWK